MESNYKKEMLKKEKGKSSFDWLLFIFLALVILLLALVITK